MKVVHTLGSGDPVEASRQDDTAVAKEREGDRSARSMAHLS